MTTGSLFDKLVKQTQPDKILIEICDCGRWTDFAKTSVCIILVAVVYLESVKVYTGPKIVRVLKRLRNTGLELQIVQTAKQMMCIIRFDSIHEICKSIKTSPLTEDTSPSGFYWLCTVKVCSICEKAFYRLFVQFFWETHEDKKIKQISKNNYEP